MRIQQGGKSETESTRGRRVWERLVCYASASLAVAAAAARRASIALACSTRAGGTVAACHRYLRPPRIGSNSPCVTRLPVRRHGGPSVLNVDRICESESRARGARERTFPVQDAVCAPSDVSRLGHVQTDLLDVPVARRVLLGGRCRGRNGESLGRPASGKHSRADAVVREQGQEARQRNRDCSWCRHDFVASGPGSARWRASQSRRELFLRRTRGFGSFAYSVSPSIDQGPLASA